MTEREKFEKWLNTLDKQTLVAMAAKQARIIEELQAATKAAVPQWIPVSERLPDYDDPILVVIDSKASPYTWDLSQNIYGDDVFGLVDCYDVEYLARDNVITHWMPLPAAPEVK